MLEFITDTDSRAETALSPHLWKSMGPLDNTGRLFFAIKAWLCSSIPSSHISIHDKLSVSVFSWPVGRRQNDIQLMHVIIIPRATCSCILITCCQSINFINSLHYVKEIWELNYSLLSPKIKLTILSTWQCLCLSLLSFWNFEFWNLECHPRCQPLIWGRWIIPILVTLWFITCY